MSNRPYPEFFKPRQDQRQRDWNECKLVEKPVKSRYFIDFEDALAEADLLTIKSAIQELERQKSGKTKIKILQKRQKQLEAELEKIEINEGNWKGVITPDLRDGIHLTFESPFGSKWMHYVIDSESIWEVSDYFHARMQRHFSGDDTFVGSKDWNIVVRLHENSAPPVNRVQVKAGDRVRLYKEFLPETLEWNGGVKGEVGECVVYSAQTADGLYFGKRGVIAEVLGDDTFNATFDGTIEGYLGDCFTIPVSWSALDRRLKPRELNEDIVFDVLLVHSLGIELSYEGSREYRVLSNAIREVLPEKSLDPLPVNAFDENLQESEYVDEGETGAHCAKRPKPKFQKGQDVILRRGISPLLQGSEVTIVQHKRTQGEYRYEIHGVKGNVWAYECDLVQEIDPALVEPDVEIEDGDFVLIQVTRARAPKTWNGLRGYAKKLPTGIYAVSLQDGAHIRKFRREDLTLVAKCVPSQIDSNAIAADTEEKPELQEGDCHQPTDEIRKRIIRLRSAADNLNSDIEIAQKVTSGSTVVRRRDKHPAQHLVAYAERMIRVQAGLRAIADHLEAGTCPEILQGIYAKVHVEDLLFPHSSYSDSSVLSNIFKGDRAKFEAAQHELAALISNASQSPDEATPPEHHCGCITIENTSLYMAAKPTSLLEVFIKDPPEQIEQGHPTALGVLGTWELAELKQEQTALTELLTDQLWGDAASELLELVERVIQRQEVGCTVNVKWDAYDIYIGRRIAYSRTRKTRKFTPGRSTRLTVEQEVPVELPHSKWHNPYKVGKDGSLEQVLEKFTNYLLGNWELMKALPELKGQRKACWCADAGEMLSPDDPLKCHGQILDKAQRGDYDGLIPKTLCFLPVLISPSSTLSSRIELSVGDRVRDTRAAKCNQGAGVVRWFSPHRDRPNDWLEPWVTVEWDNSKAEQVLACQLELEQVDSGLEPPPPPQPIPADLSSGDHLADFPEDDDAAQLTPFAALCGEQTTDAISTTCFRLSHSAGICSACIQVYQARRSKLLAGTNKLLIIGCSQSKDDCEAPIPAICRYTGPMYKMLAKFQERDRLPKDLSIWILSAEFGLIPHSHKIPNYDRRMSKARADELRLQVRADLKALAQHPYQEIYVDLGKDYLEAIADQSVSAEAFFSELFPNIPVHFGNGGIGQRVSQVKKWIESGKPPIQAGQATTRHIGLSKQQPRLCGALEGAYYLASHLTPWQAEGRSLFCPECFTAWQSTLSPHSSLPTPHPSPAEVAEVTVKDLDEGSGDPIVKVWRRFGEVWSYIGQMGYQSKVTLRPGDITCLPDINPNDEPSASSAQELPNIEQQPVSTPQIVPEQAIASAEPEPPQLPCQHPRVVIGLDSATCPDCKQTFNEGTRGYAKLLGREPEANSKSPSKVEPQAIAPPAKSGSGKSKITNTVEPMGQLSLF